MVPKKEDSLRVLQVTWHYFPHIGGVATHVYEVAKRLAARGVEVTVLATDPSGQLATQEVSEGVQIQRVRAWPPNKDYYFSPGIYRVITQGKWDIIHCQGYQTLVQPVAMLAALRAKIPFVLTFHTGGHSSRLRRAMRSTQFAVLRPLLARAERLITIAQWEQQFYPDLLRLSSQHFVLIPNGGTLPQVEKTQIETKDETLIVSIGRLERYKGHHRVIAALPMVLKEYPNAHLRILGNGPYEEPLRKLAQNLGVADRVEIKAIPASERQEMASLLSRAALVTLLSEFEGHPISIMEALALGRPVLTSDHPGLQEFTDKGLARSVPLKSTNEEVAKGILNQLYSPLIPANIVLPTWDDCATNLLDLYATIVARKP